VVRIGVITHTTAGRGGIEQVVATQVAGLRARGHDVVLVTGPELGAGALARATAAAGLTFRRTSRLRRCDVLLAHYQPAPIVARRARRPFVHYLHHPLRAAYPTQTQRERLVTRPWYAAGAALAGIDRRAVRAADAVAVPSPAVAAEVTRIYDVHAELLPLGVDTDVFTPGPAPAATRRPLLFVGRPEERYKHLDWALEVARRLGCPLDVVGDARPRQVPGVDVRWHGFRTGDDLVTAYRSAGVLLFPSVHEDFGLVPLEAMACGLPVIGWDDGHGPSTTLASGSGGVLVGAYDLDALTAAAKRVLGDAAYRQTLAAAGPRWVRERFSVQRHLDGLTELLQRVSGRPA
jgi:glycosyltransferase involved in cell wall biosynthesis